MTFVWNAAHNVWEDRGRTSLDSAWFRLPAVGCIAHWAFTGLGASLVDTVNSITLAPNASYPDVVAGAYRGVPCVVISAAGFLEGWDEVLRYLGDVTIEAVLTRNASVSASVLADQITIVINRGAATDVEENNHPYNFGFDAYGTQLYLSSEHGTGIDSTVEGGPAPTMGRPTYVAATREGATVRLFADGVMLAEEDISYTPTGATSVDQSLCVGGDKDPSVTPRSGELQLFSLAITHAARSPVDIAARYAATLGNLYA